MIIIKLNNHVESKTIGPEGVMKDIIYFNGLSLFKPRLHYATFVEQHWWIFVQTCRATKIEPCGRPFNIVDHCSPML